MLINPNQVYLESGVQRISAYEMVRVFFVYCLPTGLEAPLTKCPFLSIEWKHGEGGFSSSDNIVSRALYNIASPIRLKMVNIITEFGRMRAGSFGNPRPFVCFNLSDKEGNVFEMTGAKGVGKIVGHGSIDYAKSYMEKRELETSHNLIIKQERKASLEKQNRKVLW